MVEATIVLTIVRDAVTGEVKLPPVLVTGNDLSGLGASEKVHSLDERALVSRCIERERANSAVGIEQNFVFVSILVAECFPCNCVALSLYHCGYRPTPPSRRTQSTQKRNACRLVGQPSHAKAGGQPLSRFRPQSILCRVSTPCRGVPLALPREIGRQRQNR